MLLKNETTIIRVLKQKNSQSLIIDCIKRTMPQWVDSTSLLNFIECDESELYQQTGAIQSRILNSHEQRIAQERYTLIAGVLPFIGDERKRCMMINLISEHKSKQTIRKYLCLYLVYQDIAALAPKPKYKEELTKD